MSLLALFGLFVSSLAVDATFCWAGLFFALVGVVTVFALGRGAFEEAEGKVVQRHLFVPVALALVGLGTVLFHVLSPWWWPPIASNWQYIDDTINLTFWITGLVFLAVVLFMAYCAFQIGRAHVCTPVTNAHIVCRLLLEKKKQKHTS